MSESRELFEPPASYPEPPKDMWYKVPERAPPQPKPKPIFPWEANAPKATRVFPRSREPSPPAQPKEAEVKPQAPSTVTAATSTGSTQEQQPASQPPPPPEPPRHIFPWEEKAPKATRVFPQENRPEVATKPRQDSDVTQAAPVATDTTAPTTNSVAPPQQTEATFDVFRASVNAWDDMPEIARYMESVNRPRKAKIQVLHHIPSETISTTGEIITSPPSGERRQSTRLTDFPTEVERPSLPVTPAPIRRPMFWSGERDQAGDLPIAEGVPTQDQWVRRFSSYVWPDLNASRLREIKGILHFQCQHCGKQNPVAKLEEFSRRQSEIMGGDHSLESAKTPPKRDMPESKTREEVEEATEKALAPKPKEPPKPILKVPSFELEQASDSIDGANDTGTTTPTQLPSGAKSPTRFSPLVMEGEAASEKRSSPLMSPTSVA